MKHRSNLFFSLFLIAFGLFYAKNNLGAEGCAGLIELLINIGLIAAFSLLLVAFGIALLRKKASLKNWDQALLFAVLVLWLGMVIGSGAIKQHLQPKSLLEAKSRPSHSLSAFSLVLQGSQKCTVILGGADVTCTYTGTYQQVGDTIALGLDLTEKIGLGHSMRYLNKDSLLVPIVEPALSSSPVNPLIVTYKDASFQ